MRLLILLLFSFQIFFSFSQQFIITDSIYYFTTHKSINHSFSKIEMINDYNPIFTPGTNDEGYTLGMSLFTRIKSKTSYNYFDVKFQSDLYTDYQRDLTYYLGIRKIIPQYFTEISYFSFNYQYFFEKHKCFLSLGTGLGINNKKRPIYGLSLYIQGGEDGLQGYHGLLENNNGQENLPTGDINALYFFKASIIKHFSIATNDLLKNKPYLEFEPGFRLGNKQIGSNLFFKAKIDFPIFQFNYNNSNLFLFSLLVQNDLSYSKYGFYTQPEFGAEVKLSFLSVGFTSIFNFGKPDIFVVKYYDKETLMRGYLKVNF
jgi:hypothetical protein